METTGISVNKTIGEIQSELAQYGATKVIIDYLDGSPEGLIFSLLIEKKEIPYKLPCRWKAIYSYLASKKKRKYNSNQIIEISKRIAWRQVYKLVQAQLAFISTEMSSPEELFLSFRLCKNKNTIYENIISNQTKMIEFREDKPNE